MNRPVIDCSAQMGGEDVDSVLFPHFREFKRAFSVTAGELPCKMIERLAYVWRADGAIQQFNFEGCERIDLNRRKKYISIDVGVPITRWKDRSDREIAEYLAVSMRSGLEQILERLRAEKIECDDAAIRSLLEQGLSRYLATWIDQHSV